MSQSGNLISVPSGFPREKFVNLPTRKYHTNKLYIKQKKTGYVLDIETINISWSLIYKWISKSQPEKQKEITTKNIYLYISIIGIFPTLYGNNIATSVRRKKRHTVLYKKLIFT